MDKLSLHQQRGKIVSVLDRIASQEDLTNLRSLAFPEMNYRRQDTQRAHPNTCGWIIGHPPYTTWLKEGSGILWVKGSPGSGKSTLMKFLLGDFETQALYQKSIQLSFFFHGRGTMLQKSRLGMYRSLLHQLLLRIPDARAEFRHAFQERSSCQGNPGKDWNWHTNELRDFFISTVEHVASIQPVNIFVDALDELNDEIDDHNASQQIISDFHELNDLLHRKNLRSTICFSCRHFPIVADNQGRDICVEKENYADISTYVSNELHRRLHRSEAEKQYLAELQYTIVTGAKGVFQWATLVVGMLVRYHNHGMSPREIRQMLAEVPKELGDVYIHILSKVVDKKDYQQILRLMRCVYLAERPLTVTEVCFAMSLPDTEICGSEFSLTKIELPTHEVMVRRIVSLSGGLVETREYWEGQTVQFIHQSVGDFLLRDGLRFLDKTSAGDPIGRGHHQLSLICANYMIMAEIGNSKYPDPKSIKAKLPFVNYATRFWFVHAEKAETRGFPQDYLLCYSEDFPNLVERWVRLYRIIDHYDESGRRPEKSSTMLHIASSANLSSVVEGLLSTRLDLEQMDGSRNRALHYASRWGHTKVVKALISAGAFVEGENDSMCTPLERAAANGHEEIVGLLLTKGADVNKMTGDTGNALYGAAAKGSRAIVRVLLSQKANVNAQGGHFGNALQAAAYRGYLAIVQLLLNNKAEVSAQGGCYGNALQAAALDGHQAIVQLLLNNKAEVNAQGGYCGNALQAAAYRGYLAIVQLLLENKAKVTNNAIRVAALGGNRAVEQLLLGNKAKVTDSTLQAATHEGWVADANLPLSI